jgi:hypothetical protein
LPDAQRTVDITSDPLVLVYLNGEEIGRTPLRYDFIWYSDYDVVLRKDDYETLRPITRSTPRCCSCRRWTWLSWWERDHALAFHDAAGQCCATNPLV